MTEKNPPLGAAAEWLPVSVLRENPGNPRKIPEVAVDKVAASIEALGFGAPLVARPIGEDEEGKMHYEIIAGHTRWRAARKLGMPELPVRVLELDDAKAKLLAIADNRTSEETDWDEDKLAAWVLELRDLDANLSATGLDSFELADAVRVSEELSMGAPKLDRGEEFEPFRFRAYKMLTSKEAAEQFDEVVRAFISERGTTNGFVEYILQNLPRRPRPDAAKPADGTLLPPAPATA